jgi:hypothetical protein
MQDADANRELFEEQFAIIMKACDEPAFSRTKATPEAATPVPTRTTRTAEV